MNSKILNFLYDEGRCVHAIIGEKKDEMMSCQALWRLEKRVQMDAVHYKSTEISGKTVGGWPFSYTILVIDA